MCVPYTHRTVAINKDMASRRSVIASQYPIRKGTCGSFGVNSTKKIKIIGLKINQIYITSNINAQIGHTTDSGVS
jgi:hypothetical protein